MTIKKTILESRDEIIKHLNNKESFESIAKYYQITRPTLYKELKRLNIKKEIFWY